VPELSVGVSAFREKAGMSQVCFIFSLFLPVDSLGSSRAACVAILPSALLVERFAAELSQHSSRAA
jgi:hypothetical protein